MDNQMTGLRCRKCGAAITADQKKCPKCGAPVLLKVMMEEEKRHLPAKEIREKDKRMRREYDKLNKEKEQERQKAEKKQQALHEKEEKKRQKAKSELDAVREKEEKRIKAAEEKAVSEIQQKTDADKPGKKRKTGLITGIILAAIILAASVAAFFLNRPEPTAPAEPQEIETAAETEETGEVPEEMPEEVTEEPQETEPVAEEVPQEPQKEPEPEPKAEPKTERKITRNNYLFPSDSQDLTEADVNGLSKFDTGLIRNEIYARKGYVFKDEPYKSYFNSQAWYKPNPSAKMSLNEHEKYNVNFLLEYERSQGWR